MKKTIKSDKDVDTFLFCEKINNKVISDGDGNDYLLNKEEINDLQGGLKVLNLEDDEDISHHISAVNKYNDIYRSDEEISFGN